MSIFDSVANLLSGQNKNQGGSLFDIVSSKLQSLTPAKNQSTVVENQQAADAAARKKTSGDIIAAIAEAPVIKKLAGVKDPGKSQQDIQDYLRGKSVVESADAKGELTTFPGQQTKVFNDTSTGPLMVNAVDNYRLTGKDIRRNEDLQNAVMGAINELGPIVKGAKTVPMEIKNYVAEQTAAQEAARLAEQKTIGQRSIDLVKDAKTKFVDVNAPIEDTLAKSLKENNLTLLPSKDITNNIDRVYRAPQLAGQFAKDHGIVDVIQQAPDINELNQYLIAKQSEKVAAGGIETGRNLAQDRALVESLAPIYEPLAQKVTKYSQDLLDEVTNSGLISKELAAKLKEAYPDYVPLNRIFNELEQPNNIFGSKATASISSQSIVKKLEGSTRVIDNPIDSLLIKTNDAIRQVEVNNTARQLASYKDLPGNPFGLEPLRTTANVEKRTQIFKQVADINDTLKPLFSDLKATFKADKKVLSKINGLESELKTLNISQENDLNRFFNEGNPKLIKVVPETRSLGTLPDRLQQIAESIKEYKTFQALDNSPLGIELEKLNLSGTLDRAGISSPEDFFNKVKNPYKVTEAKVVADNGESALGSLIKNQKRIENISDELLRLSDIDKRSINDSFRVLEKNINDLSLNKESLLDEASLLKDAESRGKSIISFLDNGIKNIYEVNPEIATAAKALNLQALNVFEKVASYPTRLAKLGITGINPAFTLANLAKDQLTGLVMSDKALYTSIANPKVFLKGLYEAIGHGKGYDELVRLGGGGTSFDIAREAVPQTVESIRAGKNLVSKIAYTIKNPSELLRTAENIVGRTEEMTRLQQYFGTKEALMKQGMSEAEASIGAARAARENTVNFARKGEFGNVMNSTMLYLNANIQGTRTFLRTISSRPGESALKIGTAVLLPTAIVTAWNLSDPKRKAAYDDIPEWERKGNFIIIPDNPTKNEDGTWNVIKIPLAPEFQNIASFVRRPLEAQQDLDPVTISEMANSLIGIVSPINPDKGSLMSTLTPQFIKPTLEVATNKNLFTGFPIVSASKEKLSPELQYGPSTTGTSKVIGNIIGASPAKIDAWIKGTVGSIAPQLLHATDMALAGLDIIPKDQIKGKSIVDAIASRFMSATGGNVENRIANKIKEAISTQADENMRLNQEAEIVYSELSKLNPNEANQKSIEIRQSRPDLFKALTQVATDDKKGLTYNDRLIQSLSVDTGNRARFIWDYVKSLPTKEEKNAYINDLRNKKIISSKVMQQLMFIKSNEK